jgi:DNA-binding GntR family transcriptional regulator
MKTNRYPKEQGSLSDRAYAIIRDKILHGVYPLGAALSRRQLAAELGMSFLPVSEALQRLEHEGLVESRPRVGTRVRCPTPQDLRDHCILREALECQSARLFAEKASSDERSELLCMARRLDALMQEAGANDGADREMVFQAQSYHAAFHMRIAECTGSTALRDAISKNQILTFNWLYDVASEFHLPPRWHEDFAEMVAGHDPDAASAAMRRHVRHGIEEIHATIAHHLTDPLLGRMGNAGSVDPPRQRQRPAQVPGD